MTHGGPPDGTASPVGSVAGLYLGNILYAVERCALALEAEGGQGGHHRPEQQRDDRRQHVVAAGEKQHARLAADDLDPALHHIREPLVELAPLVVVAADLDGKRDNARIRLGAALDTDELIDALADQVEDAMRAVGPEVPSSAVGLEVLDRLGFQGYVGLEYKPRTTTAAGLGWAAKYGIKV